jgi:hypothetical protein
MLSIISVIGAELRHNFGVGDVVLQLLSLRRCCSSLSRSRDGFVIALEQSIGKCAQNRRHSPSGWKTFWPQSRPINMVSQEIAGPGGFHPTSFRSSIIPRHKPTRHCIRTHVQQNRATESSENLKTDVRLEIAAEPNRY